MRIAVGRTLSFFLHLLPLGAGLRMLPMITIPWLYAEKKGHFAKNPMSLNSPRTTARALTRCFLNQGCFRRNEQSSGCPLKNAPTQGGPGEDREPPQQDRGQIEHKRRHRRSVFTEPAETLAGGDLQLIQRSPIIEAEDLGISFSPQHDVDDY